MSSPPSTSGSDPEGRAPPLGPSPTSALALSGLLKVQRQWSLAFSDAPEEGHANLTIAADGNPAFADGTGPDETVSAGSGPSVAFERRPSVPGNALRLPTTMGGPSCRCISRIPSGAGLPLEQPQRSSRHLECGRTRTSSNSIPIRHRSCADVKGAHVAFRPRSGRWVVDVAPGLA